MNCSRSRVPPIICVDLDGTLVRTDTLVELFLGLVRRCPWLIFHCLIWLSKGKANLKTQLASRIPLAVELLPYNEDLINYLRQQKSEGRSIILATAADERVAQSVADHLGWIDEVIASDGKHNLRGSAKADELVKRFGVDGFAYAGNEKMDLPVWEAAGSAIVVSASKSIAKQFAGESEALFTGKPHHLRNFVKAIRVYQWVKNLLVFIPLFARGDPFDLASLGTAGSVFLSFSLTASGVYLLNDLVDLEADRAHQRKRYRPFAHGSLPLVWGLCLGPGLIVVGLAVSLTITPILMGLLLIYVCVTSAYSIFLKTKPLIDAYTLSLLYTMRIIAGAVALDISLSIWLLSFSGFLFLSLAFLKRVAEIPQAHYNDHIRTGRRGYNRGERDLIVGMGIASGFSASIVLALYLNSDAAREVYISPEFLWGLVPLYLFWVCRLWLSAQRGHVGDDPIVYAAKDWVSWLGGVFFGLIYLIALHGYLVF